jgi:raffinose/stachyose/melibiose transport system substrate-binding protein
MPMSVRAFGLLATLVTAGLVAGCGPSGRSTGTAAPAGGVSAPAAVLDPATVGTQTLEVWTAESATRLDLVRKRAAKFMQRYPNIRVNITVRDFGSYPAQLKLALSSDSAPDVAIGNIGWSLDGPLIKAGLLRDLEPWAKAYGWDQRYSKDSQQQLRFTPDGRSFGQGSMYGIPYAADLIGWFYNIGKLKALKLALPATFSELEHAFAAAKAAGEVPMMLGNRAQWPGLHVYYTINDNLASTREVSALVFGERTVSWRQPSFVGSAARLARWHASGYFQAGVNGLSPADANARFAKGEGVFLPAGSWNAAELAATMQDNVGFFATPPERAGEPRRATGSLGYGWHITSSSRHANLAAAFIDFMSNEDWARELFAAGDIAPFTPAGFHPQMPSKVTADIYTAWQDVLAHDTLLPYLDSSAPSGGEVIFPTMQAILAGELDPARGMADIEAARQKFLATLQ